LKSYAAVGVDGLYVDAPESVGQLKEIARHLKPLGKPLLFNMARSGKSPYLSLKEVYALGFDYAYRADPPGSRKSSYDHLQARRAKGDLHV